MTNRHREQPAGKGGEAVSSVEIVVDCVVGKKPETLDVMFINDDY